MAIQTPVILNLSERLAVLQAIIRNNNYAEVSRLHPICKASGVEISKEKLAQYIARLKDEDNVALAQKKAAEDSLKRRRQIKQSIGELRIKELVLLKELSKINRFLRVSSAL